MPEILPIKMLNTNIQSISLISITGMYNVHCILHDLGVGLFSIFYMYTCIFDTICSPDTGFVFHLLMPILSGKKIVTSRNDELCLNIISYLIHRQNMSNAWSQYISFIIIETPHSLILFVCKSLKNVTGNIDCLLITFIKTNYSYCKMEFGCSCIMHDFNISIQGLVISIISQT